MIKKIPIEQLKPGMYIHDLNCGWMDHPFVRNQFLLAGDSDLATIREAGIRELYIDTQRGDDVSHAPTRQEVVAELDQKMQLVAEMKAVSPKAAPLREEMVRAKKVKDEANKVVHDILGDVRLGRQIEVEKVEPVVERMTESILRNQDAMLSLLRIKQKDDYTFLHSLGVCALLIAFARAMKMDERAIRLAGVGGMLHDIGKMRTPDAVLNKPGKLTDDEFVVMKDHVVQSRLILENTPGIDPLSLEVAAQHHERYDGSGYPQRLKGEQISRMGQMAAIVDVYDAITSDRCYHKGMTATEGLRKIVEWGKFHFNEELSHWFVRTIGVYPVGTLVMLESDLLAIVLEQNESSLLLPKVRVVYDAARQCYVTPRDVNLSAPMGKGGADRIVSHEFPGKWKIEIAKFM